MRYESEEFTPVEVTKIGQLEHLLERESDVRETRTFTGGLDTLHRFNNPDFRSQHFDEPPNHEIIYDKALLRGLRIAKRALMQDVVFDAKGTLQPEKHMIVKGLIEAYDGKP